MWSKIAEQSLIIHVHIVCFSNATLQKLKEHF